VFLTSIRGWEYHFSVRGGKDCGFSGGQSRASPKSKSLNPGACLIIVSLACCLALFPSLSLPSAFCGCPLSPTLDEETKKQGKIPDLAYRSEYGFEKNGLRFPSRYSISLERREPTPQKLLYSSEEKKKTATQVEVVYSEYKFFTVEVEVKDSGDCHPEI
jgi:hypothetical protein